MANSEKKLVVVLGATGAQVLLSPAPPIIVHFPLKKKPKLIRNL
jgi:hypothetical protein